MLTGGLLSIRPFCVYDDMLRKGANTVVRTKSAAVPEIDDRLFIGTLGIDCLGYTKACIDSVQSSAKTVKFVYMDNGSTDESCAVIDSWKQTNPDIDEFQVVKNGCNLGVGPGWNRLIQMALEWSASKIVICNNDISFGPYTLDGLCKAYDRLREEITETVMVTAANKTKNPVQLQTIAQEWNYHEHPDFSCFLITPETIERCGLFSVNYVPGYFEDNDYHHRILLSGYKAWGTDWAPYSHIASRTRHAHPDLVTHDQFRYNRALFYRNLLVQGPDQEVQDQRYQEWIKAGGEKHPDWLEVLRFCVKKGIISKSFVRAVGSSVEEWT